MYDKYCFLHSICKLYENLTPFYVNVFINVLFLKNEICVQRLAYHLTLDLENIKVAYSNEFN